MVEKVTNMVLKLNIPKAVYIVKVMIEHSTIGCRARWNLCFAIVKYFTRILLQVKRGITMF